MSDQQHGTVAGGALDLSDAYAQHRERLLRICMRALRDRADAEDAVHEIFARVARRTEAGIDVHDLSAYLTVVARSVCIDMARRRRPSAELAETAASGEDVQQRALTSTALGRVFACLTARERSLLIGSAAGFSLDELATRDGGSPVAVARALVRARARARTLAGRFGSLPSLAGHVGMSAATSLAAARESRRRWTALLGTPRGGGARLAALAAITAAVCGGGTGIPGAPAQAPAPRAATPSPGLHGATGADALALSSLASRQADRALGSASRGRPPAAHASVPPAPRVPPPPGISDAQVTALTQGPGPDGRPAVYATGTWWHDCAPAMGSCPVVFRSDDGGHSWQHLAARGYSDGSIVAVNGGRTLLVASSQGLERSEDGGAGFHVVSHLAGPIAVDPGSPAGAARVLVGSVPLQVYDTAAGSTAPGPILPPGVTAPHSIVYTEPGYAVIDATAADGDQVLAGCDANACRLLLDTGDRVGYSLTAVPGLVVAYHDGTMLGTTAAGYWGSSGPQVLVSADAGRSFAEPSGVPGSSYLFAALPATGGPRVLAAAWDLAGAGVAGSVLATSSGGGASFDPGATVRLRDWFSVMLPLGGDRLVAVVSGPDVTDAIRCSSDAGVRWATC